MREPTQSSNDDYERFQERRLKRILLDERFDDEPEKREEPDHGNTPPQD